MNAQQKEQYDNMIGSAFIDSMLIAKEHNYLLFADEESIRSLAFNEFQVRGFPNYVLFNFCFNKKVIEQKYCNEVIAKLIALNYKYLPVNAEILMKCADMSDYQPKFPFDLAIKTLDYSISSEDSSIQVAAEFFYKLYALIIIPQILSNLVIPILHILVNGRNPAIVMRKLMVLIEIKFRVLQKQKEELFSILTDFIKTYNNY